MWSQQELEFISPNAIQKRIPFTISATEISNFIGNMTLIESFIPTTQRSKYILQAIVREIIINKKSKFDDRTVLIPKEIQAITASPTEACLLALDSYQLPDLCNLKLNEESDQLLATVISIHSNQQVVKGIVHTDFGLTEKQSVHLQAQQLIRIPVPQSLELQVTLALSQGNTMLAQRTPIEIPHSVLGLIIDTRDSDILVHADIQESKQMVGEWMKSLDITFLEG